MQKGLLDTMNTIGRYRILGMLGKGGTGRVYKVLIPEIDSIVALKWLWPNPFLADLMGMDRLREMFLAEARIMAGFRHPNLLSVWDYGVERERPYYTMEYLCDNVGLWIGEHVEVERPTRPLPVDMALRIARETLCGLARMHADGWIHRDIKPFNLLLTNERSVKIADFGLSATRGGKSVHHPENLKIGSPYYAAPEQENDPASVQFTADLYSVGVTFYRMLTGRLPHFPLNPIETLRPELDGTWNTFFRTSLAHHPRERFQTAADMTEAILGLQQEWERQKERICRLEPEPRLDFRVTEPTEASTLRSRPRKIGFSEARTDLGLDDWWRPLKRAAADWEVLDETLVLDRRNRRVWERSGSAYPENVRQALARIEGMNRCRYGGIDSWRLPTVDELITLVEPPSGFEHFCAPPVFDPLQKRLWSSDRKSATAFWFVSLDMGFVGWLDNTGYAYSRAVAAA